MATVTETINDLVASSPQNFADLPQAVKDRLLLALVKNPAGNGYLSWKATGIPSITSVPTGKLVTFRITGAPTALTIPGFELPGTGGSTTLVSPHPLLISTTSATGEEFVGEPYSSKGTVSLTTNTGTGTAEFRVLTDTVGAYGNLAALQAAINALPGTRPDYRIQAKLTSTSGATAYAVTLTMTYV